MIKQLFLFQVFRRGASTSLDKKTTRRIIILNYVALAIFSVVTSFVAIFLRTNEYFHIPLLKTMVVLGAFLILVTGTIVENFLLYKQRSAILYGAILGFNSGQYFLSRTLLHIIILSPILFFLSFQNLYMVVTALIVTCIMELVLPLLFEKFEMIELNQNFQNFFNCAPISIPVFTRREIIVYWFSLPLKMIFFITIYSFFRVHVTSRESLVLAIIPTFGLCSLFFKASALNRDLILLKANQLVNFTYHIKSFLSQFLFSIFFCLLGFWFCSELSFESFKYSYNDIVFFVTVSCFFLYS
ncbi:MAG: hypothetical protein QM632_03895 [Micrococcaceae bacterium]